MAQRSQMVPMGKRPYHCRVARWRILCHHGQGIIYGIAGNALVMPTINLINEWFSQKRGLAIGIAIAGDFAGGVVMPLILQAVLNELGFRWVS